MNMEITWYGLSCFRLMERGKASVVTDPFREEYGYVLPKPRGDIVTISRDEPTRNAARSIRGPSKVLDGPGEYEIGEVFTTGVSLVTAGKRGKPAHRNTIFVFDFNRVTVCHLGGLSHVPTQSQIEALGTVDVLLTPVGGVNLLRASQAAEVISMLEPNLIIPMHFKTPGAKLRLPLLDSFLKEMGTNKIESVEILKVSRSTLPNETQVVLLTPQH